MRDDPIEDRLKALESSRMVASWGRGALSNHSTGAVSKYLSNSMTSSGCAAIGSWSSRLFNGDLLCTKKHFNYSWFCKVNTGGGVWFLKYHLSS